MGTLYLYLWVRPPGCRPSPQTGGSVFPRHSVWHRHPSLLLQVVYKLEVGLQVKQAQSGKNSCKGNTLALLHWVETPFLSCYFLGDLRSTGPQLLNFVKRQSERESETVCWRRKKPDIWFRWRWESDGGRSSLGLCKTWKLSKIHEYYYSSEEGGGNSLMLVLVLV